MRAFDIPEGIEFITPESFQKDFIKYGSAVLYPSGISPQDVRYEKPPSGIKVVLENGEGKWVKKIKK